MPIHRSRQISGPSERTAIFVGVANAALLLVAAIVSHWAILSNDSFGLRFQADHLTLTEPVSFYNAFYPIGYPLILRLCGLIAPSPFPAALVLQIALAGVFAYYLEKIAVLLLTRTAAVVAVVGTLLVPGVVRAELSTVPDLFSLIAVTFAVYSLFEARPQTAGMWIGIASLFRFHAIGFAVAVGVALIGIPKERRAIGRVALGLTPFVAILFGVQLWSVGSISVGSGFNIWKTMHGMDWSNVPAHFDRSAWQVIMAEPRLFFSMWAEGMLTSWYVWLPLLVFVIATLRLRVAPIVRVVMLAALLYHLFTVPGGSPRGPVLIAPIVVIAAVWCLVTLTRIPIEATFTRRLALAAVGGFALVGAAVMLLSAANAGDRVEQYELLGNVLHVRSLRDAARIYTDDFALYFPKAADATPRTSGGWPELGLPTYASLHPHITDSTASAFYSALRQEQIQFAVFRARPLNPHAAELALTDSGHFEQLDSTHGLIAGYRVFRVR